METLVQQARQLFNIHLTGRQVTALLTYERELIAWNEKFNLTAIRQPEEIRLKHFLDSFSCVLAWRERPPTSLVDVGTGAGFPGLPLKILYPSMRLTLIESIGKKANFCRHLVDVLKLENVEVIHARAEEVGQDLRHREMYEWAVARAVANLPVLVEYLLPLVRVGGVMLSQKGASGPEEAHRAERAIRILGGNLRKLIPVTLPGIAEDRYLILVDKIAATPKMYPRRPGEPAKKPL
ncbi:MAG: 16S rRNA (guanine(527)-N(7))-methyltransferase RsmG [Anaerolineales bacterium]|nr:16S rRNA (guanine(527)-N(7))-methyltransferase RsmG [Anaerolineales bacterium]MCX7608505.1 16S rRNA (guanine(527)-N(7))-methyltransferase RsmG [Anaerolineales bacterium]MDW8226929.1 16S rRNA (guanine(527)-N(7))-methyltransferase RsmG [Anaerolineales bacterium]